MCSKWPQVGAEPWDSEDKASVHQGRLQYLLQYCRFVFKVWLRGCCTWGHESEMCVCVCNSPAPDAFKQNMCSLFSFLFLLQSSYSLFIKHPNEGIHREIYCGNSELRSHQQRSTKWLDDPQRVIMWNRAYWSNGPKYPETAPTMDAAHSCFPRMSDNLIERFERRKKKTAREKCRLVNEIITLAVGLEREERLEEDSRSFFHMFFVTHSSPHGNLNNDSPRLTSLRLFV